MNKKIKKLKFTLIEITVAFGVLAILIMFLMQFLNTAQTSWNFAEKRARAYADSRAVLDFIERGLNSSDRRSERNSINTGTSLSYRGTLPYGDGDYLESVAIGPLVNGVLKFNGEDFINNVAYFYSVKTGNNSILVRLDIFGSDEDYKIWSEETDVNKKNAYKTQHGFTFIRLINLQ